MIKLRDIIAQTCCAGELDEVHAYASEIFKLPDLFDNSMNNLRLKAESLNSEQNERLIKLGIIVSFLFGFGSLSAIADGIIKPFWKYFNFPLPESEASRPIFFIILSAIIILFLLVILWMSIDKRVRKND